MSIIAEMVLIFGVKSPVVQHCAILCAQPYTNAAASLLWIFHVIHLVPTHFFLYSFYIIPRRFNASQTAEDMQLTETELLNQPLLYENLMLVQDDTTSPADDNKSNLGNSRQSSR